MPIRIFLTCSQSAHRADDFSIVDVKGAQQRAAKQDAPQSLSDNAAANDAKFLPPTPPALASLKAASVAPLHPDAENRQMPWTYTSRVGTSPEALSKRLDDAGSIAESNVAERVSGHNSKLQETGTQTLQANPTVEPSQVNSEHILGISFRRKSLAHFKHI